MADQEDNKCGAGLLMAFSKRNGAAIDDVSLSDHLGNDIHAKSKYAAADERYREWVAANHFKDSKMDYALQKGLTLLEHNHVPIGTLRAELANPDGILGRQITDPVVKLYEQHLQKLAKANPEWEKILDPTLSDDQARLTLRKLGKALWKRDAVPQLEAMQADAFGKVHPELHDYAYKYFQGHIDGGKLYGKQTPTTAIGILAKNISKSFIDWNPTIAAWHGLSSIPRAIAIGIEHGGANGPTALFNGIGEYLRQSGGKIGSRIQALEDMGVYGPKQQGKGFLGLHSIVDPVENVVRSMAYYMGEHINPGDGHMFVEKIALAHVMGNEPLSSLSPNSFHDLGFMRYTIGSTKFFLHLASSAATNPQAATALLAFGVTQAVLTGNMSNIPAFIAPALPQEVKDSIKSLDDLPMFNIVGKAFNTNLSQHMQPLAVPSLGVPLALVNEEFTGAKAGLKNISKDLQNNNPSGAAANFVDAVTGLSMLSRNPYGNISIKRLTHTLAKTADDEVQSDPQSVGTEYLKESHLYVKPQ